jgi:hypothetical protein
MPSTARGLLLGVLIAGLCEIPAAAGTSEKPLAVVLVAEHAHLTGTKVVSGTTVYAGDALDTEESGTLGLRVGTSQFFLLSASAVTFGESAQIAQLRLTRGTMVFSSSKSGEFEVETPAGVLRAIAGQAASGRVALTGPNEMVISAYRGGLVLDNDGEMHSIPAGKAYRVVIEDSEVTATAERDDPGNVHGKRRRRRLAFYLIVGGATAAISFGVWEELSESPYKVK